MTSLSSCGEAADRGDSPDLPPVGSDWPRISSFEKKLTGHITGTSLVFIGDCTSLVLVGFVASINACQFLECGTSWSWGGVRLSLPPIREWGSAHYERFQMYVRILKSVAEFKAWLPDRAFNSNFDGLQALGSAGAFISDDPSPNPGFVCSSIGQVNVICGVADQRPHPCAFSLDPSVL